ncbi:MAG: DUF5372 family protein [Acidimicrobiia bacterium]
MQAFTVRRWCVGWRSPNRTASDDRWVSQRSRHRARSSRSSPVSDSVVVTHPFHPLSGERLVVILERRRPGAELVLVCEGGPAGRVTVPVGWTDRAPVSFRHRLDVAGLVELAGLVAVLDHPRVARRSGS